MAGQEKAVVIGGVPTAATEEYLRLYFENKDRSGGGHVENIRINRESSTAVVTFADPEGEQH